MKIALIKISTAAVAAVAAVGLAGCGGVGGRPSAAPTVTHTVTKWKTRTMPAPAPASPAPTVTKTVYPPPQQPGTNAPGAQPGANQVITRFSGAGSQNTRAFVTPSRWHLSWAYWGCPDGTSNFIVNEYNTDGSLDPNGISVNEFGTGRGPVATYAYGDAGEHYLSVTTEGCHWSLVPVTG